MNNYFQNIPWWKDTIGSKGIDTIELRELNCFDIAWQKWFDTKKDYALRDKQYLDTGLKDSLNFISIIVKRSASE